MSLWSRFQKLHTGWKVLIVLSVIAYFPMAILLQELEQITPPSTVTTKEVVKVVSNNPYDRITEIVRDKYKVEPDIFDTNNNITRESTKPPFDVIVITNAHTCGGAKLRAWDITRDLYRDSIAGPAIGRVKVMVSGYVTTSLGSAAASKMNADTWGVGSSIFFKAVQAESRYETYSDEGRPLAALTFGVEQQGCRE